MMPLLILQWAYQIFLGNRIGVGVLCALIAFAAADVHRARLDELDWAKRQAAFEAAQKARDLEIDHELTEQATKQAEQLKAAQDENDKLRSDFNASLKPLPAGDSTCRVGDDVDRLRAIGGLPASQHKPGLRKARKRHSTS